MIEFIFIKEVARELGSKDYRTVKRWCEKNGVGILSDFGRKKYLIKAEFEAAKIKQAVNYIKEKYGSDKLPEYFNSLINFFSKNNNVEKENKYKLLGEHEKSFLNCLQNINSTL